MLHSHHFADFCPLRQQMPIHPILGDVVVFNVTKGTLARVPKAKVKVKIAVKESSSAVEVAVSIK